MTVRTNVHVARRRTGRRLAESIAPSRPSPMCTTRNPPPPRLPAPGSTTASANAVAIAASTAFPPLRSTVAPTCVASGASVATIPCGAVTPVSAIGYGHDAGTRSQWHHGRGRVGTALGLRAADRGHAREHGQRGDGAAHGIVFEGEEIETRAGSRPCCAISLSLDAAAVYQREPRSAPPIGWTAAPCARTRVAPIDLHRHLFTISPRDDADDEQHDDHQRDRQPILVATECAQGARTAVDRRSSRSR